jgi:hypothetical protein
MASCGGCARARRDVMYLSTATGIRFTVDSDDGVRRASGRACADDIASTMREEYYTDSKNRRVRLLHPAFLFTQGERSIVWDDMVRYERRALSRCKLRSENLITCAISPPLE